MGRECHYRRHLRGCKLTVYEFSYAIAKPPERILSASIGTICDGTTYHRDSVRVALQRLTAEGWLEFLGGNRSGVKKGGQFKPNRYRVVSHDTWVERNPGMCKPRRNSVADLPYRTDSVPKEPDIPVSEKPGDTRVGDVQSPCGKNSAFPYGETSDAKEVKKEREKKEEREAAYAYAQASFEKRFSQPPGWGSKDQKQLDYLFNRRPDLTIEEFKKRWDVYLNVTDPYMGSKQGWSLAFFCSRFDSFMRVPAKSGMRKLELPDWAKGEKGKSGMRIIKADRYVSPHDNPINEGN